MATGGVKKFNELFLYPKGRKTFMQKTLDTLFDRSEGKKFAKTSSARISVRKPRALEQSSDQDWMSVWPAAQSFRSSVVPLPIRMGYLSNKEAKVKLPRAAYANLELMKIPNFLHLTPHHIQRHCNAIKIKERKFCTKFPDELKDVECQQKYFPLEFRYSDYIHQGTNIRNESECHALQNAVNNLVDWNTIWGLNVSLDKTVIFHIGNKNPKFNYYVNNNELPKADIVKDLGVITNNKLTFEEHINHVRNISMLRSVQLLRNIKSTNPKIWGNYFKMYVLPLLEYASPVWNPSLKKSIKYIERVQKFYTRMALRNCKILRKISYDRRLDMLNLEPLYLRRFKIDLITLYKIVFRHTNINPLELFTFNQRPSRKHSYIINIPHKTSKTHNSFTNRIIKIWNSLPKEALNNSTITSFKLWLINNLKNVLSKHITL
uniref:Uncharacterized protein n=1 Tax=Meloidogyne enterolobii TaxID=390850 RepID=A0A6V7W0E0_MELEN|nr:unnamed protein product [Meloidogyne enterolobii]